MSFFFFPFGLVFGQAFWRQGWGETTGFVCGLAFVGISILFPEVSGG
jgi:hypothetical protein